MKMSITETKLFKNRVESPEIVTNKNIVERLQATSAEISGIEISPELFNSKEITFTEEVNVKDVLTKGGKTPDYIFDEQVLGFSILVPELQQFDVDLIQTVTIYRKEANASSQSFSNDVYVYVRCESSTGQLLDTFYSSNAVRQSSNDVREGGCYINTWNFDNFYLKRGYHKLIFGFTTVSGQEQNNIRIRSCRLQEVNNINGEKLYIDGWQTKYPNQSAGNEWKNFTTYLKVTISRTINNLLAHARDTDVHLDNEKKEKIDSIDTLSEQVLAFTESITEKITACEEKVEEGAEDLLAHKMNMNVHLTDEQKQLITNTNTVLNSHKNDTNLHVNQILRNQITTSISNSNLLSSKVNSLNSILSVRENFFTTLKEGFVAASAGKMDAKCIQISKQHFTSGTIKAIEIPYYDGKGVEGYLAVQVFYDNEPETTVKPLNQTYFSTLPKTQTSGSSGVASFEFSNLTIPDNYKFVRLMLTANKVDVPNGYSGQNCLSFRVRVLSLSDNNTDYTSFDDDDCKIFPGSGNYVGYVNVTTVHSILDQTGDVYTAGVNVAINDSVISVPTVDVIANTQQIPSCKAIYDELFELKTFNNLDTSKYTTGADSVGAIVLGKKHFVNGFINKVTIPHDNKTGDGEGQNGYLVIQVFDEALDENDEPQLEQIAIYYSINEQQYDTSKGKYEFDFNEALIPKKYKEVHLSVVQDSSVVPSPSSINNKQFRILCLKKNGDKNEEVVFEQDDECYVYWKTNTDGELAGGGNYVAVVNVEYTKNKLDDISSDGSIFGNIADYEGVLDNITYTTTDFLPTGQNEGEDSVQKIQILLTNNIKSTEYTRNKLTKVSLHRHNTDGNYNNRYYLQIRAWDKETNELYKFNSYDSHAQNESKVVTWNFEDTFFESNLKDEIVIGFLTNLSDANFVGGTPIRVGTWGTGSNKWYLEGWKVSWNDSWQNRTPHVSLHLETTAPSINHKISKVQSNLDSHIGNNDVHMTTDEKNLLSTFSTLQSNVNSHIGDSSHLTDAQKSAISQVATLSSNFDSHKTSGGTLHVTADDKTKWNNHVDDDTLHVTAEFKDEISDAINVNTVALSAHTEDEDIHFSKSEIMDNVAGSLETWDMSLGASVKGAQGIAYAQICNNHVLQEGSYLSKIVVPQHTSPQASEVTTGVDLYLVIFGDNEDSASSDETKWQFITCSVNEGQQQIGGNSSTKPDLVFEFEKGIDLGLYRRYRFFYVTDRTVTPTLPTVFGSGYTGVKMAFPSRGIDADCKVRMAGGGWATSHTFPAIIHFIKDSAELRSINHKDNDEKHLTVGFRDTVSSAISKISEIEDKINDINFVLGVEKQEYTTFSSELPVPTDITNQETTQILLASSRCVSGKIKKIEIPYTKGKGTTGYLAVQIIHSGESANIEKTLEDTYFSTETQTQTNNQSGVSTFHFDNLFIPSDFYAIRLSFVSDKNTAPDYGGSNCLRYAIRMVSITESDYSNPVHNHDGYKVFNPANQGYSYSNTSYGVIVSVESVKSSFDFITGELHRLKKVIS